jgi:hypothetical protein
MRRLLIKKNTWLIGSFPFISNLRMFINIRDISKLRSRDWKKNRNPSKSRYQKGIWIYWLEWLLEGVLGKHEYMILFLYQHHFFHGSHFSYTYNLSNAFGFELRLPYSYDFSKVTSCFKKFIARSGTFFPNFLCNF